MNIIKIVDMKKCLDAVHFQIFFELKFVWKLVIYLHFRVTGKNWANLMAVLQKRGKNSSSLIENKSPKAQSSSEWIWINCDTQQKLYVILITLRNALMIWGRFQGIMLNREWVLCPIQVVVKFDIKFGKILCSKKIRRAWPLLFWI